MGTGVLQAAALGFLGLGAQPPTPEWGRCLAKADSISNWLLMWLAIFILVLGFNLFGDGLRDILDPSLR